MAKTLFAISQFFVVRWLTAKIRCCTLAEGKEVGGSSYCLTNYSPPAPPLCRPPADDKESLSTVG